MAILQLLVIMNYSRGIIGFLSVDCFLSLFSSMRGRQKLSCPVLRPPSGPNARPQCILYIYYIFLTLDPTH